MSEFVAGSGELDIFFNSLASYDTAEPITSSSPLPPNMEVKQTQPFTTNLNLFGQNQFNQGLR